MPTPTLPADCRVETLAEWMRHKIRRDSDADIARSVRALLEAKVREAVETTRNGQFDVALYNAAPVPTESIVSRVLGAP